MRKCCRLVLVNAPTKEKDIYISVPDKCEKQRILPDFWLCLLWLVTACLAREGERCPAGAKNSEQVQKNLHPPAKNFCMIFCTPCLPVSEQKAAAGKACALPAVQERNISVPPAAITVSIKGPDAPDAGWM